jgi:hypothetical protein
MRMSPILTAAPVTSSADAELDFGHFEDRDLTRRIVGFLSANRLLNDASLLLRITGGHVELRGTVSTFRQRRRIEDFIRRVASVHQVANQLVVGVPRRTIADESPIGSVRRQPAKTAWPFHD